jgi:hypothetical protein
VAGFFEDLPVLMTVLLGVSALVLSGAWVSRENAARCLEDQLNEVARDICRSVLHEVISEWGETPRVSTLIGVDILSIADVEARKHSFSVTLAFLFPNQTTVTTVTCGDVSKALTTGFARLPFNALTELGLVVPMEVRAIAW